MQKTQFQTKQSRKKLSPKRLLGLIVALVIAFLLLASVIRLAEKHIVLRRRIRELNAEQSMLTEKKETLIETNRYLETPEGAEQALRDKYNLVKPGEGMIVITPYVNLEEGQHKKTRVGRWWEAIIRGLGIKK